MKIAVSVDDVGASVEDDEPINTRQLARIVRVLGDAVIQVYDAASNVAPVPDGAGDEP